MSTKFTAKRSSKNNILKTAEQALDLINNIVESSTEYSIIGKDLKGNLMPHLHVLIADDQATKAHAARPSRSNRRRS